MRLGSSPWNILATDFPFSSYIVQFVNVRNSAETLEDATRKLRKTSWIREKKIESGNLIRMCSSPRGKITKSFVRSTNVIATDGLTFCADSGIVVSLVYIGTSRSLTLLLMLGAREPCGTERCVGRRGCDSAMKPSPKSSSSRSICRATRVCD